MQVSKLYLNLSRDRWMMDSPILKSHGVPASLWPWDVRRSAGRLALAFNVGHINTPERIKYLGGIIIVTCAIFFRSKDGETKELEVLPGGNPTHILSSLAARGCSVLRVANIHENQDLDGRYSAIIQLASRERIDRAIALST